MRAKFNLDEGVNMELCVRSESEDVVQLIISAVG